MSAVLERAEPSLARRARRRAAGSRGAARRADDLHRWLLAAGAAAVFGAAVCVIVETTKGAWPALQAFGAKFFVSTEWDPVADHYGALPYLWGTLVSSALAMLFAVPTGIATAVFLSEIAPRRIASVLAWLVELLASIPSIVYGIWGLFVLAPWLRAGLEPWLITHAGFLPFFRGFPFGIGMLNAGLVLAIMIVPTIVSISREVLRAMPVGLREAALALGATRGEAIRVVLDAARPGILGAAILALGRALGETMAVTMVIGNTNRISLSLLAPGATMASVIANEFTEATGTLYLSSLIEIAFVLFAVTLLVNVGARILVKLASGGRRDVAGAA